MVAILTVPYRGGLPRLSTILLLAVVVIGSIVWGRFIAPRLRGNLTAWRVVGIVWMLALVVTTAAIAGPPIIRDPCWVCSPDMNWAAWILSGCWACSFE